MLHFVHYGEREHIEQFFKDGSIQIGTLRAYDVATHGLQIGDDEEGLSFCTLTDSVVQKLRREGRRIPPHLEQSFGPGCLGNVVLVTNLAFNYAIYCVSRVLHKELCKNFKDSYNAAIYIERPFPFFYELTKAFAQSKIVDDVVFQHIADVCYRSRQTEGPDDLEECFIKEERYQHQAETRAIWSAGENPPSFFRFKAPDAVRCCRPVLFEDMPDYTPGADLAIVNAAMEKALNASTRSDYLSN